MSALNSGSIMATVVVGMGMPLTTMTGTDFSSRLLYLSSLRWGILILVGEVALLLMGFKWAEIVNAFRQAAGRPQATPALNRTTYLWEAAARNALHLGVLGTLVGFVMQICSDTGGQADFMFALGKSLLSTVCALILAALLSTPALRALWTIETAKGGENADAIDASPGAEDSFGFWGYALGYVLFFALIVWLLFPPVAAGSRRPFDWFVHWPALLVVFGGALGYGLLSGRTFKTGSLIAGFGCSGLIGALVGVVQALQGFSQTSIAAVSEGIAFMISSCFAAHLGLLAIGLPLQDRGQRPKAMTLSRLVWYGFPVVTLLMIVLATLMAMIPLKIENP